MTAFLLIRHATVDAVGQAIAGRAPGVHLADEGRRQAEALADRLAGEPIRRLCSSPLERARQTAKPLAARLELAVEFFDEINEVDFGAWTGRRIDDLERDPHWRRYNTFRSGTRPPGGESMIETQARAVAFLKRLRDESPEDMIAVVSHGDVIRAALLYFLGIPLDHFLRLEVSPASVSRLALTEESVRVDCVNVTAAG